MKKIFNFYVKANLILFPLFCLPIVYGSYTFGKNLFLFISACLGLIIWAISLLRQKSPKIYYGRGLGIFFIFLLWVLVNWLKQSPSTKTFSLSEPNGFSSFISLFIWYFLYLQSNELKTWSSKLSVLKITGVILAIISLVVFVIPESKLPINIPSSQNALISINQYWSLTGSLIADLAIFIFLCVESARFLIKPSTQKDKKFILMVFQMSILSLGLILSFYRLSKTGWGVLDRKIGWQIAVDTFKNSPIFGIGISNFIKAFNLFRPYFYNKSLYWQDRYIVSTNGFYHFWTELGFGYILFLVLIIRKIFSDRKSSVFIPLLLIVLINLLLPPNLISLWLLVFVLSHKLGKLKSTTAKLIMGENKYNIFPALAIVFVLVFISFGSFIASKKILARYFLRNSYIASAKNDGLSVYNFQIKAISFDPNWAELRKLYSQTNLGLAQTLSKKENLEDQDKEQISVLLQQSIREAKTAVSLSDSSAIYWFNLATIYRNLVGVVEGAPDWAAEAYQQTAVLDNADPVVRMELGSLYFAANQFENADRYFEEVLVRKEDYANGWYNWAHTAKKLNRLSDAVSRLSQAVSLVPIDSTDYEKATKELNDWKKELEELNKKSSQTTPTPTNTQETLKTAEPLPTVSQNNPVDIPKEDLELPETTNQPPSQDQNN